MSFNEIKKLGEKILDLVDGFDNEEQPTKEIRTMIGGYEIILLPIEEFESFYKDNLIRFTSYSEKQFLGACKIPSKYFLAQPEDTKDELLKNHSSIIKETKALCGKHIVIVQKEGTIFNCVRLDYSDFHDMYERTQLNKYLGFTHVRTFIKEGYFNCFIPYKELSNGVYNLGIFVDIPIMCNKSPMVHSGFYYLPKQNEDTYKQLYLSSTEFDVSDYQTLDLLIEDSINNLEDIEKEDVIIKLKDKVLLRELEEILIKLSTMKVIPKGYVRGVCKYVDKTKTQVQSIFSLIDLLVGYDLNMTTYKSSFKLRSVKNFIEDILKGNSDETK